jgi:hypothetical protein
MSNGIAKRFGPYLHAEGYAQEKTFNNGDRAFMVVISGAYDAGIIGPEINGIAIFDKDNRQVVLDQEARISSGYDGPSDLQIRRFNQIMAMDWSEFSKFCKTHPRYRGSSPDITDLAPEPEAGDALQRAIADNQYLPVLESAPDIRTDAMKQAGENKLSSYSFPLSDRDNMMVFLANHKNYHPMNYNNGGYVLAWDIKVRGSIDTTGRNHGKESDFEHSPEFDERWNAYVEENYSNIFDEACNDGLRQYTDGDWVPYDEEESGYKFYTNGRSGGYLILQDWPGPTPTGWASCKMTFSGRTDFIEYLKDLSDQDLAKLYKVVVCLDHDLENPHEEISYQFGWQREQMEEEWQREQMEEEWKEESKPIVAESARIA